MAPTERTPKRQKLSPTELPPASTLPDQSSTADGQRQTVERTNSAAASNQESWYSRTWPRKAAPITQVARESISSASNTAVETATVIKDKVSNVGTASRKSSLALTLGKSTPKKSRPVLATTTTDHATSESRNIPKQTTPPDNSSLKSAESSRVPAVAPTSEPAPESEINNQSVQETSSSAQVDTPAAEDTKGTDTKQESIAPRSWIGWLARTDDGSTKSAPSLKGAQDNQKDDAPTEAIVAAAATPLPQSSQAAAQAINDKSAEPASVDSNIEQPPEQPVPTSQRRSWLPVWNNVAAAQSAPTITSPPVENTTDSKKDTSADAAKTGNSSSQPGVKKDDKPPEPTLAAQDAPLNTKPSAWIFWSREKPSDTVSLKDAPREGEIAVANTDTESQPRRASLSVDNTSERNPTSSKASKDVQPDVETTKKHGSKPSKDSTKSETKSSSKATKVQSKGAAATAVAPAEVTDSRTSSPAPPKKSYEHLLLPSLHDTLKLPETPTLLQQLSRLFYGTKEPDLKHVDLVKDPPKLKSALAIGVHGYFPAPLIRSVLGQPTGTSIKFADMAAKSIQRWTKKRGYECHVKTAALEGEGKIAERIDLLWKLLLNWIDDIRRADFVMIACHSQGVPVAIMLMAKLIHFGCITAARVGICAMAGVNMGPFPEFKSRWISGSASELFEFSDSASKVSVDYLTALEDVLKFGVKLTYVGSIDDQLVSLESSIFAPVSHPHLYRAVSIDSRLHAPDFVSHLVAFALKLRNLGVQDHGLIRELSAPLAGSLYSGEGHSRLYEDSAIYDLAVSFALETSSMPGMLLSQRPVSSTGANPFILPFAMRGILEEDFVKSDLQDEASLLLQQFDEWKPTTKALKDVKFRLEGIRSKL